MTYSGKNRRTKGEELVLSAKEFEQIAHQAADEASEKAVRKVFAILGVDIDEPAEVESFRDDLRFGRRLRKAADRGFLAFAGVGGVAMAYALWDGIVVAAKRLWSAGV